jgi:hypothetical protein
MYRVLKPIGKLILTSPLNFKKAEHWKMYYPPNQLSTILKEISFKMLDWKKDIMVHEPLDEGKNLVPWKHLGFVVEK